jgi:hypothetical protein
MSKVFLHGNWLSGSSILILDLSRYLNRKVPGKRNWRFCDAGHIRLGIRHAAFGNEIRVPNRRAKSRGGDRNCTGCAGIRTWLRLPDGNHPS